LVFGDQAPAIDAETFRAENYGAQFDDPTVTADGIMDSLAKTPRAKIAKFETDLANTPATAEVYRSGSKVWSQERKKLHKKIIRKLLTEDDALTRALPVAGEQPTFVTFGGRGGSGKSWFTEKGAVIDKKKFLVLDNDEIKKRIPEFLGWNAGNIHEESSAIFELLTRYARRKGLNIAHDATLRATGSSVRRLAGFQTRGYRMEGYYMFLPRQDAAVRAVKRALGKEPRYVPVEIVLQNTTNEKTFDSLRRFFDRWQFYDNQVPKGFDPTLIASSF
jgi:predicted ABC-type ATPase